MFGKINWIWLGVGIAFALFVLPMIQGFIASRKAPAAARG